jgi:hypothetical protein
MIQEKLLFGQNEELQAIFIPASASSQGVKFITNPTNDLQVGLMTRDDKSPVASHRHKKVKRIIETTQEFLLVRSGIAEVFIYNEDGTLSHRMKLLDGDSILLISGAHKIDFLTSTQLLEVKQGPYLPVNDKIYLGINSED